LRKATGVLKIPTVFQGGEKKTGAFSGLLI
jgi:hypothetical protein